MLEELKRMLAAIEHAQVHRDAAELLTLWERLADWIAANRDDLFAAKIVGGSVTSIYPSEVMVPLDCTLLDCRKRLAQGADARIFLLRAWVARARDTDAGYQIRVDGVSYRLTPKRRGR